MPLHIVLGILLLFPVTLVGYLVVQTRETGDDPPTYYLLSQGVARRIPLESTSFFGVKLSAANGTSTIETISTAALRQFRTAEDIAPIRKVDGSVDEAFKIALERIDALQARIIDAMMPLASEVKNPTFSLWGGRQLLIYQEAIYGREEKDQRKVTLHFAWGNLTGYPQSFDRPPSLGTLSLFGMDQRVLVLSDTHVVILFTVVRFNHKAYQMAYADLFIDPVTGNASVVSRDLIFHSSSQQYWAGDQFHVEKNWGPFLYNNTVLMIESVNPLRVLRVFKGDTSGVDKSTHAVVAVVSRQPALPLHHWEWGDLRGGTNAVLVSRSKSGKFHQDLYIALFHSRFFPHSHNTLTYFFGGYAFSASPPFKLIALSNAPIVDDAFYTGKWLRRGVCYVPYPTALWLEGGDKVRVSLGFNDVSGTLLSMDLRALLDSLVAVGQGSFSVATTQRRDGAETKK